jgi:hypothetical protein
MQDALIAGFVVILLCSVLAIWECGWNTHPVIVAIESVEWQGSAALCLFYGVTVTKTWYHHFHKQTCTEHIVIADSVLSRVTMDVHSREVLPSWIGSKLVGKSTVSGAWTWLDEDEIHSKIKEE